LRKASPTAEIFPDANALFTKIQDLFCSRDKNVVFHGQYSIPEVAGTPVNEEVAQAPPSTNEAIIHAHQERMWRTTGYRWKWVLLLFRCRAVLIDS
jgi:hypothetical protein